MSAPLPITKKGLRAAVLRLRRASQEAHAEAKRWEDRYYAEHQKIVDLALEHSPKLRASNEDDLPGFGKTISLFDDKQPEFTCNAKNCAYFWPCPTYQWATGTDRFKLVIERQESK